MSPINEMGDQVSGQVLHKGSKEQEYCVIKHTRNTAGLNVCTKLTV